jgi:autotransporter-associated beta strand protein
LAFTGTNFTYIEGADVLLSDTATTNPCTVNLSASRSPGSLTNNSATNYIITGSGIAGSATLYKLGTSTLTLVNSNSFTGNTVISAGTLQLGNGTTTNGIVAGRITNNAALAIANPLAQSFSSEISGTGSVTKSGAGTLSFFNAHTYSGTTTINAGRVNATGTNTVSAFVANSGATLSGSGVIASATVNAGGLLSPGVNIGTLTITNSLTLTSTSTNEFELTNSATIGGGVNDLVEVGGNLNPGSSVIGIKPISGVALARGSTFRLFNYTGTKSGSFNSTVVALNGSRVQAYLDESVSGQINLNVSNNVPLAGANSFSRPSGSSYKIKKSDLLANDTDGDLDTLTISAFDATTTNGATLTSDATYIFVPTNNVADAFNYTVSDAFGGSSTATVTLNVVTSTGQTTGSINTGGGNPNLKFYGIPGSSYTIQVSTNLSTWTDVTTLTAGATGVITYTDSTPPTPAAYYRTRYNP